MNLQMNQETITINERKRERMGEKRRTVPRDREKKKIEKLESLTGPRIKGTERKKGEKK